MRVCTCGKPCSIISWMLPANGFRQPFVREGVWLFSSQEYRNCDTSLVQSFTKHITYHGFFQSKTLLSFFKYIQLSHVITSIVVRPGCINLKTSRRQRSPPVVLRRKGVTGPGIGSELQLSWHLLAFRFMNRYVQILMVLSARRHTHTHIYILISTAHEHHAILSVHLPQPLRTAGTLSSGE